MDVAFRLLLHSILFFFFNDTATTEIYTLSLHDAFPISGRLVSIAPDRSSRPGVGHALIEPETQEELDACPFCAGREVRTPPETRRLPKGADAWVVRVVPNLYPAVERQEV